MTYSVHPVTDAADLPAIGRLNTASKLALSINKLLWKVWPNEDKQQENCLNAVKTSFENPECDLWKAVDDKTGELVGYMTFIRRKPAAGDSEAQIEKELSNIPDKFNPEVFTAVIKGVNGITKTTEHFDQIQIIFTVVAQSHRRQGIGSQLLNLVLDRARTENLPVVTQSEPAAYEFFKHHGFKDTTHVDWDLSKWATPMSGFGLFRLQGIIWHP